MSNTEERDRFLADQALKLGEPILSFAFGRIVEGPPVGSDLVFLFVGSSSAYLVPSVREGSIFGLTMGSRKSRPDPDPVVLSRERAGDFHLLTYQGWWANLTGPRDVIQLGEWKLQLFNDAAGFVTQWKALWASAPRS